jgi:hypothetical protein
LNISASRFDHAEGTVAGDASPHGQQNRRASFVGQWAPTLLIPGVYNKLVKQLGSDSNDYRARA